MNRVSSFGLASFVLLSAGCGTTAGVKIEQPTYDSFIVGKTTQAQVRGALGSPQMASFNGNDPVDTYSYSHGGAKNFIPGYAMVAGAQIDCVITTFEYSPKLILARKYTNNCSTK